MEPIVGIDLGTTNSEIAFIVDDNVEVIKDNDSGIIPSCVGINDKGKIIVGEEAKNQAVIAPDRTVLSIKRKMGSDQIVSLGNFTYRPQEISAFIIKALKSRAEKILKKRILKAVITVPAYFTDAQRNATREAGEIAELKVVRIINEPTAAALAYESVHSETKRVLIFDLGGGTFDVSIVKIEKGVIEVLSSTGDNHLGGDDFDKKIMDLLVKHCEDKLKISVKNNPLIMARLKRAAENAKITLSSEPYAEIEEDHIGKRFLKHVHLSYELSRIDFEKMIEDDISRTMEKVNKALKDADLTPKAIDKIILVGGSTRIPYISAMLKERFSIQPHSEIDPDLCVALGAGIQAGREMGLDSSGVLLDITPYTFGTSVVGEIGDIITPNKFVPIIRRNTKLPASKTDVFSTIYDNQKMIEIKIYQGEKANALDNILIGKYKFELTKAPANSIILINFNLDLNGILKIKATEKKTGRHIDAVIENAFSAFSKEELSESKRRIADMWEEDTVSLFDDNKNEDEEDIIPSNFQDTLKNAQAMLDNAPEEDKDEMIYLMKKIRAEVKAKRYDEAEKFQKDLEDIMFYLE